MNSLLDAYMKNCVMMDKVTVPDGVGGFISRYQEGAAFKCAIALDNSMQARIGQQQGVTNVYTISTPKAITLQFHDVIKDTETGKIFRITSDGTDKATPSTATLDMRAVSAEEWSLPNG